MRSIKIFLMMIAAGLMLTACEKHVIQYEADPVKPGSAEFQLHYFNPVVAGAANNIYRVEINGEPYATASSPLNTYNAVPSGAVGLFYTAPAGMTNIKLYRSASLELVYDRNFELKPGKQNVFVHDFNKDPIVFDNLYPYPRNVSEYTDTMGWVRFFNFLYEEEGVPTPLKLQYQFQYVKDRATMERSEWLNVGQPVAFGEATGWQPIPVIKEVVNTPSPGYARIDYRIRVIGTNGEDLGPLQVRNNANNSNMVDYSDWWNCYVGRHYMHILAGMRVSTPLSSVRQFTSN